MVSPESRRLALDRLDVDGLTRLVGDDHVLDDEVERLGPQHLGDDRGKLAVLGQVPGEDVGLTPICMACDTT